MNWFILALAAPLFWSIANYLDKFILSRSKNDGQGGSGGLFILSCLVSVVFAVCILFAKGTSILTLPSQLVGALIFSGMFQALYLIFYFWALEKESTTTVISLFQFAPVMGLLFGYFLLSEIPNSTQIFSIILILAGTLCIVYKKNTVKSRFKWDVLLLMLASTAFVGFYNTLFKLVGETTPFWTAVFWQYLGIGLIGLIFFVVSPVYQKQTYKMIVGRSRGALMLTGLAEFMNIAAVLVMNAAVLIAPVALVLAVSSVQPFFVLVEGLIIVHFFPKILDASERPSLRMQYVVGVALVCVGGFLIY